MTVQEVLRRTQSFFKEKGFETARLDAELLISNTLGWPRVNLYTQFSYPMSESELETCRKAVRRRMDGEPVAYIIGKKGFFKQEFIVNSNVLIPRPETEFLVEKAIEYGRTRGDLTILDLGTGSGCVGLSLLKELPQANLKAYDISPGAIDVARENAKGLEVEERVEFVLGDIKEQNLPEADIIVANPPYIAADDPRLQESVKNFEPGLALFAERDGLQEVLSWTVKALQALSEEGLYLCEIGQGQKADIEHFLRDRGEKHFFYQDYSGIDRGFGVQRG